MSDCYRTALHFTSAIETAEKETRAANNRQKGQARNEIKDSSGNRC